MKRLGLPGPSPRQGYTDNSSGSRTASIALCKDVSVSGYEEAAEFSLFRSSCNEKDGANLKSIEMSIVEGISVTDKTSSDSPNNRSTGQQSSDYTTSIIPTEGSLPSPDNSMSLAARCADDRFAPGNVVWAKNASHEWWPAEVIDESGVLEFSNSQKTGHIFVRLYGSHECTWLDPAGNLSHFDQCCIEMSKNPSKSFQDALKQALYKNSQTGTFLNGCSDDPEISNQHGKPVETRSTPSSSRRNCDCDGETRNGEKRKTENRSSVSDIKVDLPETTDDCNEGKGKRKRKVKAQSDELNLLKKRRARQSRIMRQLGLIAPVGSSFARKRTTS